MIRLLELRTEKELSQRKMAQILNISQGTYNNWENANTQPSIEQLIQLAKFFEVSVDYLVGNTDATGTLISEKRLSDDEQNVLRLYNALAKNEKEAVKTLMASALKK
ncbi:MAG: helix-turn-helix transcriptional regulator [Clostridiales bacterium]|nr:helix-turn-helix transcriptional regulator [Clostridiales bacterium]